MRYLSNSIGYVILAIIVSSFLLLTGCVTGLDSEQTIKNGYRYTAAGDTQMWRASLSQMITEKCTPVEGLTEQTVIKTGFWQHETHTCHGKWVRVDVPSYPQSGVMASFVGPVLGSAAIGAGVGTGLAFSGSDTNVNQQGGGANSQSNSRASSRQWQEQGQHQGQAQGQIQRQTMPLLGGMD